MSYVCAVIDTDVKISDTFYLISDKFRIKISDTFYL